MIIRIVLCALFASSLFLFSCKSDSKSSGALTTSEDSIGYYLGISIGSNIKKNMIEKYSIEAFSRGLSEIASGDSMDNKLIMEANVYLQKVSKDIMEKKMSDNMKKGVDFLAENKGRPGVKTTASGLQYIVVNEGKGESPNPEDQVVCNYEGSTIDGKIFDSSIKTGKPATFGVDQVIPGWTEALKLMKAGAKWKIFIPSNLAYGTRGVPNRDDPNAESFYLIEPNSVLIFDLELISIEKGKKKTK